jgi:transmembrane sensor
MEKKIDWTAIAKDLESGNSQTNSDEGNDSRLIWNKSASLASKKRTGQKTGDFKSALSQMKHRIASVEEEEEVFDETRIIGKRSRFSRNQLKYVASVSILMMLSFVAFYISQNSENKITQQEIQKNNTETPKDFILADGTSISLAKGSKLVYPNQFIDSKRIVKLEGKAFFNVKRDETKPFLIETKQANVEVLGTSFDLEDTGSEVTLIVKTGKVAFSDKSTEKGFKVSAGESAQLNVAENTLTKTTGKDKFDNDGQIVWGAERIAFKNVALEQIIDFVADWKNIEITWKATEEMKSNSRVTSFEVDKSLNEILGNVLDGTDIKFENSGDKIVLK